jgi:PAS domain S-box-containing protein
MKKEVSAGSSAAQGTQEHLRVLEQERSDLCELFERFYSFQERLAELDESKEESACYEKFLDIVRETLGLPFGRVLGFRKESGAFETTADRTEPGCDRGLETDKLRSWIEWVRPRRRPVLIPLEGKAATACGRSLVLVPISGKGGELAMALLWVPFDEGESSRFILRALEILSRETATAVENIRHYREVRDLQDLLDHIIESIPQAILAVDRQDRILNCNRNWEYLFGLRRIDLVGENYRSVLSPALVGIFSNLMLEAFSGEAVFDQEHTVAGPDGRELVLGVSASLMQGAGGPRGIVFICRDMSLSREVQKLRELDQMKSEFVHTVSHELKTPLTAILGGTEILMEQRDRLDEEQRELVQIVDSGGKRLSALISDLLDVARMETGRMKLDISHFDLTEMVSGMIPGLQGINERCRVRLEIPPDLPRVKADPAKIRQVFENLLSNALKYSPEGGTVTVRAVPSEGRLEVSISDQGIGISEKDLPFIWDKFYRVDSSTTAEIEGTGLGLAIVKHIMEAHGEQIASESKAGEGTTFRFRLPLAHDGTKPV